MNRKWPCAAPFTESRRLWKAVTRRVRPSPASNFAEKQSVGKAGFHRYMETLSEILLSADFGRWLSGRIRAGKQSGNTDAVKLYV